MELLAVGGLAYLGTILNNSVLGEYDKISNAKSMKKPSKTKKQNKSAEKKSEVLEKFNFFNKNGYVKPELDSIQKKYERRAGIMKKNSFNPTKSKVGHSKVPDAPFKDTWYQLALKRAIKEAVDKGYDRIGLTTGAQQASRYNLSNEVDEINVIGRTDARTGEKSRQVALDLKSGGSYKLGVNNEGIIDNVNMLEINNLQGKNLADVVGKEVAKKIMESNSQTIKGEGLNIGGEGMKKYYDEIYPNFLNKYGKKYGAQVGETKVNTIKERAENSMIPTSKQETVRYLDITPEMKKAVQKGQPLAAVEGMTGLLA